MHCFAFGFHRRAHLGGSPTGGKAVSDRTASFIASAPSLGSCLQSEGLWGVRTLPAAGLGGGSPANVWSVAKPSGTETSSDPGEKPYARRRCVKVSFLS